MADEPGRPEYTEEEKKEVLQKLEPYLKTGLSVRKALIEAQVNNSKFYRMMERDDGFREQINRFRQFISILLTNSVVRQLQDIVQKQNSKIPLTDKDISFLQWFAVNSKLTREEFGERKEVGLFDPEAEIQRLAHLLDENSKEAKGKEDDGTPK